MKPNRPDTIGTALKDILRRLRILETAPQLTRASIKDGALRILDADFEERAKFGRLDGDLDGDTEDDWGLVIFDAAGDWALLGTKAGVFVRGAIQGGTIDIGGSDASSFHVDTDGNLWVGAALFAAAPFRVAANGDLVVEGAAITAATIRTSASGRRVELDGTSFDRIRLFTGNAGEDSPGSLSVQAGGQLNLFGPSISGVAGGGLTAEPGRVYMSAELAEIFADTINLNAGLGRVNIDPGGLRVGGRDTQGHARGGSFSGTTDGSGDLTFAHGMFPSTPAGITVTMSVGSAFGAALVNPVITAIDNANVTVRFYDSSVGGSVFAGALVEGYFTAAL